MIYVEDYEKMRMRVVEGAGSGSHVGITLVRRQGVAAWMKRILSGMSAGERMPAPVRQAAPRVLDQLDSLIVRMLANMALAGLGGTR